LAADFTNDSKRSQASGANSSFSGFLGEGLGMEEVLAEKIGKMTIAWNDCQGIVFMIFHSLLDSDLGRAVAIFFAIKSDTGQRDITIGLAKYVLASKPGLLGELTAIFTTFNATAGRRNDFIHAIWRDSEKAGAFAVWFDVRKRLSGKDPVVEIDALIA
jgi:hypothetical protein